MDCLKCRGACCEEIVVKFDSVDFPAASKEFFGARGIVISATEAALESRCPLLTMEGLCSVHETCKPLICAMMPTGGEDCYGAVRRRRTHEQYLEIRGEDDPERIHPSA